MAVVALALLCLPLGLSSTSHAVNTATVTVNGGFTPKLLTVQVGTVVTWQLADAGNHRLRSLSGPTTFDSGGLAAGGSSTVTFTVTFTTLGTINYGDDENQNVAAYMGSVSVVANVPPTVPPSTTPGSPGQPPAPSTVNVRIANRAFGPSSISVAVGDTVLWTNADKDAHTVTDRGLAFDSGSFGLGATFQRTFGAAGTFTYICDIHPSMVGVVSVSAPTGAGTLPPPPPPPPAPVPVTVPPAPGGSGTTANSVSIIDFGFSPAVLNVAQGATVTWSNSGLARHTVAANDGSFHSPDVRSGQTYARTFSTPGTFTYICDIHPEMKGTIAVSGPGGTPPPPPSASPAPVTAKGDVTIADFSFSPARTTITAGQSLTFVNTGVARHTATASDGSFDTGTMIRGASVRRTFATPGTLSYFCTIHPNMKGTILVRGAHGEAPPPPKARPVARVASGDVSIVDFAFAPTSLTVSAGAAVGFVNNGVAPHTATAKDGTWDTGIVRSGTTTHISFGTPGTFTFYCTIHPQMIGTILVTGADGSAPPPAAASAAPQAPPMTVDVNVLARSFEPANARIAQGGTVVWTISSRSPHRITADDQSFESTLINHGTSFMFRFDRPGTYTYHDGLTGDMSGTVTVVADPGSLQAGSAANGSSAQVNIIDLDFDPREVTVVKGATVTWTNTGQAPHTVTDQAKGWSSDLLKNSDTFSHTFASVGRFTYICTLHPTMVGTVIVTDSTGVAPGAQLPQAVTPLVDPERSGRGSTSLVLLVLGGVVVGLAAFVLGRRTAGTTARA